MPTELTVALPHMNLRAQTWGDPTLPPLLALHGWLDNAGSFALLAPILSTRWHVIALDLPGHGYSDHLPAGMIYHFTDYVRAVLAVAETLQLPRYHLLGHSLGAGIASMVAAAAPHRLRALMLIEGLGPLGDDGSRTLQRYRDALTSTSTASKGLRRFRDIAQAASARAVVSGLRADLALPIVERGLQETSEGWHWRSDPRLTRSSAMRLAETQICSLLHGIESPTALLLARPDTSYLGNAMMEARAARVTQIAVTHMDGGHHLHLEHPEAVARWIGAHLGE